MPTMWFAQDGPRPNSQRGPGIPISAAEAQAVVGVREVRFVGAEAPSINSDKPSHSLKNVVLEVEQSSDVSSLLPEVGFYFVVGIAPSEAEHLLNTYRGQA
jgi:hypothetical protein